MEYPFERAAMRGDPMPEGLTGAEQILFSGLSLLYARVHMKLMDRDAAKREKVKLVQFYESIRFDCDLWKRMTLLWKELEGPMTRYQQSRTLEQADRCMEILYGVKMQPIDSGEMPMSLGPLRRGARS